MSEIKTISMEKSQTRKTELKRRQEAEERRKRELRAKRKRMRQIRLAAFYSTMVITGLILILVIISLISGVFSKDNAEEKPTTGENETKVEEAFDPSIYSFTPDMYMYECSGEVIEKIENLKNTHSELTQRIDFIIDNLEAYPEALLKLIAKSPEAISFAIEYPFKKGQDDGTVVDLTEDYVAGEIPLLIQWDDRWGYVSYGTETISLDGCGPTCLSMVAVGLTGNIRWTPVRMARMSMQKKFYVDGQGTSWELMYEGCKDAGLEAKVIGLSEEEMKAELKAGRPIIASMGPGDFTEGGHFIVLVGYEDGGFKINDPNSRKNSETIWKYDVLKGQIKNMWSYELKK